MRGAFTAAVLAVGWPAAAAENGPREAAVWLSAPDGVPFRVRFDPGHRLLVGTTIAWRSGAADDVSPGLEIGLALRSRRPPSGTDVHWSREHELLHLRPGDRGGAVEGHLYRGAFLRKSREGTLAIPTSPPMSVPLPFDIGVATEIGRLGGVLIAVPGGRGLTAGIVHAEVLADFWRSPRTGQRLALGIGGGYDLALARAPGGPLVVDHRVAPMTALSLVARCESPRGLVAGGVRLEAGHRWSSEHGWQQDIRAQADAELTPIAINDLPLSVFAQANATASTNALHSRDVRAVVGIRLAAPLP